MIRLTLICSAFLSLIAMSGCQSMPWQKDTLPPVELLEDEPGQTAEAPAAETAPASETAPVNGLPMAASQRFKDVPLPADAKDDPVRSYVYEGPGLQVGRMVYSIRADVSEIAQFYIDASPAADWKLISVKEAAGGAELLFRKPGKKLEVSIIPLGMFRGKRLILNLVPEQSPEAAM